jgi:hypothetical protein
MAEMMVIGPSLGGPLEQRFGDYDTSPAPEDFVEIIRGLRPNDESSGKLWASVRELVADAYLSEHFGRLVAVESLSVVVGVENND